MQLNLKPDVVAELCTGPVLITGATGFIGYHVCQQLAELGATVYGLSRSASGARLPAGVRLLSVDITSREALQLAFEQVLPVRVLNLAAIGVDRPFLPLDEALSVNVTGTANTLRAAQTVGVRRFIHVGTCYEHAADRPLAEGGTLSTYAVSKLQAWKTWQLFVHSHAMQSATLRLFHVYGPGQVSTGLISSAIEAALCGSVFDMTPGEQQRDFVFIDDVVTALLLALAVPLKSPGTYDIGTGLGYSVRSVVSKIFEAIGGSGYMAAGALHYREHEIMQAIADPVSAQHDLEWRAQISLAEGLVSTINWHRQQRIAQTAAVIRM
jgi:nucleoside-diphosphate-sugar epimerase